MITSFLIRISGINYLILTLAKLAFVKNFQLIWRVCVLIKAKDISCCADTVCILNLYSTIYTVDGKSEASNYEVSQQWDKNQFLSMYQYFMCTKLLSVIVNQGSSVENKKPNPNKYYIIIQICHKHSSNNKCYVLK